MVANAFLSLEIYKDQFALLIQAGLLIATFVLIWVGFRQAIAAKAQAKAAEAQVVAANAQVKTAQLELDLSVKQLYASLSSSDAATRPILQVTSEFDSILDLSVKTLTCVITNCGLGPALDIEAFYGTDQSDAAGLYGEFLGVGAMKKESFEFTRICKDDLIVRYSSTQGSRYETRLCYSKELGLLQFHRRVMNAFDGIIDEVPSSS